jgi:hypothetical protein
MAADRGLQGGVREVEGAPEEPTGAGRGVRRDGDGGGDGARRVETGSGVATLGVYALSC